jgi:hypothetical protein
MCNNAEWEKLRRRVEDTVESEELRSFISDAAARVDSLIVEMKVWTCAPEKRGLG